MKHNAVVARQFQSGLLGLAMFSVFLLSGCATTDYAPAPEYASFDGVSEIESVLEFREQHALEEICWDVPCRENFDLIIRFEDEVLDTRFPLYWPHIHERTVSLMPGESFYIEVEEENDFLIPIAVHSEQGASENFIRVGMTQGENGTGTMITLSNPFQRTLKVHAHVIDYRSQIFPISSCSVLPGSSVFSSLPHPIPEYFLTHMRFIADNRSFCAY